MNKLALLLSILLYLVIISCEKNEDPIIANNNNDSTFDTTYYDSEIFPEDYLKIYGNWKLYNISGGFTGQGHEAIFEYLKVEKYGVYSLLRNDSVFEYGKIQIEAPESEENFVIRLIVDQNSDSIFFDAIKIIEFYGNDSLFLNAPCCDRFNYHFVREN